MGSFLFTLVAVFAVSLGGRDQFLVARLAERLGRGGGVLVAGLLSSALSALAMATAGLAMALVLPEPAADMLVAFALVIAAVELAWPRRAALPEEPTRSLFATFIVLLSRQVGDAARFIVFAFAAGGSAWFAGAGGALGGFAAIAMGAVMGADLVRWPLRPIRLVLAAVLFAVGLTVGLAARGLIG